MLLKSQSNQLFEILSENGLEPLDFTKSQGENWYQLEFSDSAKTLWFEVKQKEADEQGRNYTITKLPGQSPNLDKPTIAKEGYWSNGGYGVVPEFKEWARAVKKEAAAPDLWAESTKALQLFTSSEAPAADRFMTSELGAVQGQLRMLGQSFSASELPEGAKQKLAEICQTAMIKAETFTKRDWQNWIAGAFANAVAALELDESQRQEVVALVRLAFGGLFLQS